MIISAAQAAYLKFIGEFTRARGYSPAIRDFCDHFGNTSTNSASCVLTALKRKGLVSWERRKARSLRLIPQNYGEPCRDQSTTYNTGTGTVSV